MGYTMHTAVLVSTYEFRKGGLPDMDAFRESLPEEWRPLVIGPIHGVVNFDVFYAFLPNGSKIGFPEHASGRGYRDRFKKLFTDTDGKGRGDTYDTIISTDFGGDFATEVGVAVRQEWP